MTEPRHIVHVVADGDPGGGTTVVLGLCEDTLARPGWRVTLVSQTDSYAIAAARERGIATASVDFFRRRLDLGSIRRLRRIVDELRPTIVHIHGARAGLAIAMATLSGERPTILYTVHGFHFLRKPPLGRWMGAFAERFIARHADTVIYVSEGDQRIARRWALLPRGEHASQVIHNGIDPADLTRAEPAAKRFDLAFVGRFVRQKNPLFMIDVMQALQGSGITLVMIGGGELEQATKERAAACGVSGSITFTGALQRPAAIDALRAARVYVFPSLWEGLPMAPLEASWLRIPVIASAVSGTDEVVIDGRNGFAIATHDAATYAATIRRVLDDPALLETLGRNGFELVNAQFLRSRSSEQYLAAYRQAIERRR